mmetsp:Transcript_37451/g.54828  ORF Transcript_37451/g.54828 Transcript_37451/m.54828 type:complete len:432 (-) Transcript_37451:25-1320(-)
MMKSIFFTLFFCAAGVSSFTSLWTSSSSSLRRRQRKFFVTTGIDNNWIDSEKIKLSLTLTKTDAASTTTEFTEILTQPLQQKEEEQQLEEGWASSLLWKSVIVILCALWASNFPAAKLVMAEPGVDSGLYALTRFGIAALALLPGAIHSVKRGDIDLETAKGAVVCGSWVAFGYLGQTVGLLTTTASKSCVICSLHCIFVAVVAEWMRVQHYKQEKTTTNIIFAEEEDDAKFDMMKLLPAAVAVAGVAIIELQGAAGDPTIGDLLSFAQPIGFGLGYLQLEELMKKKPEAALPVSAIKLIVVAFASFLFFECSPLLLGQHGSDVVSSSFSSWTPRIPDFQPILSSTAALSGILYTGLITTALALWIESIAFKRVPATEASIILTTEPLFAAGAAAFTLGETFGISDYVGATMIIGACILAVLIEDKEESII